MPRLIGVFLLSCSGCAVTHVEAWETTSTPVAPAPAWEVKLLGDPPPHASAAVDEAAYQALVHEGEEHWARRDQRAELEAAITAWNRATDLHPDDGPTLANLSHAAYLLADGYLSFEKEHGFEQYKRMHELGMSYAERALMAQSKDFKGLVESGLSMERAVVALDKSAVPALYWYSANLGKWAVAQGTGTILKYRTRALSFVERCLELDESYYYWAPHRWLGAAYARMPRVVGGDLKRSRAHFDKALAAWPHYLATRVLWAEFYATKAGDKAGFRRELQAVLESKDDVDPELIAENRIEKKKALELLGTIDSRF
jgi:hypothetical protein